MIRKTILILCGLFPLISVSAESFKVDMDNSSVETLAKATGHSMEVYIPKFSANITTNGTYSLESVHFEFAVADLTTEHQKRDKKMRKWLNTAGDSTISYEQTSTRTEGDQTISVGELTMHGVSKEIEIPFIFSVEGTSATIDGEITINHLNWDLEIIRMFFMTVNPELTIAIHLEGTLSE